MRPSTATTASRVLASAAAWALSLLCVGSALGQESSGDSSKALAANHPDLLPPGLSAQTLPSVGGSSFSWPTSSEVRSQESNSDAPLMGAVIGGAAGAVLSLVLSDLATGSAGIVPLFVLGGAIIGYGIGTAY